MSKTKVKSVRTFLMYSAARCILFLFTFPPECFSRGLAWLMGSLFFMLDRDSRKRNSVENIMRAFPDVTRSEARSLLRRTYRHFSMTCVDAARFIRAVQRRSCERLIEAVGFDRVEEVRGDSGVIFVSGHFGQWEVLGAAGPLIGYPTWSMYRGFRNAYFDAYLRRQREATGQRTIEKTGALWQMLRLVRSGEHLAFLIDQDARRDGIFVDFFGRPASTPPSPARLAVRTGAPVAFVHARRSSTGAPYRITVTDVIQPDTSADRDAEIQRITQRLTTDLEDAIRETPEQWLWLHRRWKTYPGKYDSA